MTRQIKIRCASRKRNLYRENKRGRGDGTSKGGVSLGSTTKQKRRVLLGEKVMQPVASTFIMFKGQGGLEKRKENHFSCAHPKKKGKVSRRGRV